MIAGAPPWRQVDLPGLGPLHVRDSGPPEAVDDAPTVRMTTNILDCPVEDIHFGMPVEVVFQKVNDELTMPYFRRVA